MKKVFYAMSLSLTLGLSSCGVTGLEAILIGSLLGGSVSSYGKPYLDKYLTLDAKAPITEEQ